MEKDRLMPKPKKRDLTPEEKSAQTRLRAAWDAWSSQDKSRTQQNIANQLNIAQTSLGHYLNGRNPLNVDFLLRICTMMKVNPVKIYPQIFEGIDFSVMQLDPESELGELIEVLKKVPTEKLPAIKAISEQVI